VRLLKQIVTNQTNEKEIFFFVEVERVDRDANCTDYVKGRRRFDEDLVIPPN
jgi:hypothetical protein